MPFWTGHGNLIALTEAMDHERLVVVLLIPEDLSATRADILMTGHA